MRILKLQFTNINSLAGTWQVDFTDPAYRHGGIFAITGPTGAGKSTILDAICLALYGCTPRLRSISMSENEAMTRLTAVCSSEVTFQTQAGVFRCTWSQRRARGKADGNLQQPKHEIADAGTGVIIESQIRRVAEKIVEVTGMDLDQFTRSMLLAQGQFAAFLFAKGDERGKLLEQITGSAIYSNISIYVHERCRSEKNELEKIEQELASLAVLTEDECTALRAERSQLQTRSKELGAKAEQLRAALAWRAQVSALEQALADAEAQHAQFEARSTEAEHQRAALARADQACVLDVHYIPLVRKRGEFAQLNDALAASCGRLPAARQARDEARTRLDEARARRDKLVNEMQAASALWKTVRELDTTIREKRKAYGELVKLRDEQADECERGRTKRRELSGALEAVAAEKETLREFFDVHASDASLAGEIGAIELMIKAVQTNAAKLAQKRNALQTAKEEADRFTRETEQARGECERHTREERSSAAIAAEAEAALAGILSGREPAAIRSAAAALAGRERTLDEALRLLNESASAREALKGIEENKTQLAARLEKGREHAAQAEEEKTAWQQEVARCEELVLLLRTIDSLTEHRAHLQDGKPCPLCGATEHPYAQGQIPKTDEKEEALTRAKAVLEDSAKKLERYGRELTKIETELMHLDQQSAEKAEQIAAWEAGAGAACAELGIACELAAVAAEAEAIRVRRNEADRLVRLADAAIEERDRLRKASDEWQKRAHASQIRYEQASSRFGKSDEARKNLENECGAVAGEIDASLAELQQRCRPYGIAPISAQALSAVGDALRSRRDAWEERSRLREAAEKREADIASELRSADAVLEKVSVQSEKTDADVRKADGDCQALEAHRSALFGVKDPDEEERTMGAAVADAESAIASCTKEAETSAGGLAVLEKEIDLVRGRRDECEAALAEDEKEFARRLAEAGFASEESFASVRLTDDERAAVRRTLDDLRDEGTKLATLCVQKRAELARELERSMTDATAEEAAASLRQAEADREDVQQKVGAIENQLQRDTEQQAARAGKAGERDRRRREYLRWDALSELIGSADGKKFRRIAQTVTFEMMVAQANHVLRKMSPRYFLVCDQNTDLEMNIVDQYQAGEVRSTKNLSGGESFIVSLSLALGLSHMASRNVRVDSLFLDEGFGTLDEEALDVALTTLSELQQEGKTIGVISHVGALKERISAQIVVTPETGGRSLLSGPGCRRIA